jgi:catechol 2,3-dioxygenase-like lactoylglutathione lyase family enzyme
MRIDHLVWYCADLAEGERWFTQALGVAPKFGGVHPGEGTRNALLSLSPETYIEILGRDPAQPETAIEAEVRALEGAGLYHFAMGGVDLQALKDRARAAGLSGSAIVTGGRTLPNGNALRWSLYGVHDHGFGALVPFFIDWTGSEHPALSAPRGGRLVRIEAATPDAAGLSRLYAALGIDIKVHEAPRPSLAVTIEGKGGPVTLRTLEPCPRGYII